MHGDYDHTSQSSNQTYIDNKNTCHSNWHEIINNFSKGVI